MTATDEFIENRIRVLPQNERVLHVLLTLNFGAIIALLIASGAMLVLPLAFRDVIDKGMAVRDSATIDFYFASFLGAAVVFAGSVLVAPESVYCASSWLKRYNRTFPAD